MTYEQQLQDPRWRKLRDEVLKQDRYTCRYCGRRKDLQVHHMKYESGKMAWEYSMDVLLTLCRRCHEGHHRLGFAAGSTLRQTKTIQEVIGDYVNVLEAIKNG